ncbi:MAG TPA: ankyrin repeat domain-containing protein, partial [Candidatus Methylacidiphilales bacterium]
MKILLATVLLAALTSSTWGQSGTNCVPTDSSLAPEPAIVTDPPALHALKMPELDFRLPPRIGTGLPRPGSGYFLGRALIDACERGDLEKVKELLNSGISIDEGDRAYGTTPLMAANSHEDVVRYLLSRGAKVDLTDDLGNTALLYATFYNQLNSAEALLDAGANPNLANHEGRLPLMNAAAKDTPALVQALLAHHAEINGNNDAGPALWRAAQEGKADIVTLLIDSGADLSLRPNPILPHRRFWSLMGCAASDKCVDIIDLLLAHGVSVDDRGADGTTALMQAAEMGQVLALNRLLEKGASVDLQNENGMTALMCAARYGQSAVLQVLLDHHAGLELKDRKGKTALMYAGRHADPLAARLLLDHGADLNAVDLAGETALTYAGDRGASALVQLLKDRGAKRTDLHVIAREMPPQALSSAQQWALSVIALYSQASGLNPNILGGGESESSAKKILLKEGDIHDDLALLKRVDYLRDYHRRSYDITEGNQLARLGNLQFLLFRYLSGKQADKFTALRQSYLQWQDRTCLAYYLCRAANLLNLGVAAHYLDEREAWTYLMPLAVETQNHFSSWH